MYWSILLPSIFALYALYKRSLTIPGIILAWLLGIMIAYCGNLLAFSALALTFILTILSDKIKKTPKDKTRNMRQIISNILTAALCTLLFALTKKQGFYIMYYAVLASSLADTLASSIGTLSKKKPVNIFTMKKLTTGQSGGVSWLGLIASLSGGVIIGLVYLIKLTDLAGFLLIALMGLIGSLVDSILGTICQAQYQCQVCKNTVEVKKHCKKLTKLIKGYPFMDNDLVNLLNNIIICILSYILLI